MGVVRGLFPAFRGGRCEDFGVQIALVVGGEAAR
jgi:hypothetical protein